MKYYKRLFKSFFIIDNKKREREKKKSIKSN